MTLDELIKWAWDEAASRNRKEDRFQRLSRYA